MLLGVNATGSSGNSYYIKSDSGKILLLDAGIPIAEIKKGLDYDIANVCGCVITHSHLDHSFSANKIKNFAPVWKPYESDKARQHTHLGCFDIECFDVPHSVPCRAFIIKADDLTILYASDFEYLPYNLQNKNINVMLIEMNYQQSIMKKLELDGHITHTVTGHSSDKTTTEIILQNQKHLQNVVLCHYSKSGNLRRDEALEELKSKVPEYINTQWAIPGEVIQLGCPF